MTQVDRSISQGQLVYVQCMQDAVAASQTDVQLPVSEVNAGAGNAIAGYIAPFRGEVVGVSWLLSAAGSAGTLTIGPTVGGTEKSALTQTVTTAASGYARANRNSIPFAAGDEIGAEITTDGSWNGTSSDLAVWVHCILYLEGI